MNIELIWKTFLEMYIDDPIPSWRIGEACGMARHMVYPAMCHLRWLGKVEAVNGRGWRPV